MKRVDLEKFDPAALVAAGVTAVIVLLGFLVLAVRLRSVQVTNSARYDHENERQSVRRVLEPGARGEIRDRRGVTLAANRTAYSLVCCPEDFQRATSNETQRAIGEAIASVGQALGREVAPALARVPVHLRRYRAIPLEVCRELDERELAFFSEHASEHPGFEIRETFERTYPQGALAAHLLGYVGRARGEMVEGDEKVNYVMMEMRGRDGLEFYYDSFLRGVSGMRKVVVNAAGYAVRESEISAAKKGPDLELALDATLQAVVERELDGCKGACVVMDPRNGDVLALASAPGFNPNDFVPVLNADVYAHYVSDPDKPLLNRACNGTYAPGSTFKPVTALAGLKAGVPDTLLHDCDGVYSLGKMRLRCSARWGHGTLDLRHALMKSCNPYFCALAVDVGTNAVIQAARAFGLGARTGLDYGVDLAGVVPDAQMKMASVGEKWYLGDLAHMSIGQGMLLATPLQMARVAGALGTGCLVTPHLKRGLPVERRPLPFAKSQLEAVREGLRMVVNGDGLEKGTGWRAGELLKDRGIVVCGKTGTAEIGRGETRRKNTWFIAYAPAHNPTVALAMVIENGESGGGTTAPKAGAVLAACFPEGGLP